MATMYPSPLPMSVRLDPLRASERRVYEALREGLGPHHSVFYGVAWLARASSGAARDGEVDFVVAHHDKGALLLEVKGGGVARDDVTGRWVSVDRTGYANEISDPYAQVRSSKHALLHKLKEHPATGHSWVGMGHGVVLPDSADPHRPLAPDAPAEITVYAEDMGIIGTRVDGMFDYWSSRSDTVHRPAPHFLETLTQLLAPRFELRQPLGPVMAEEDRQLLRLTEQQFGVLDLLGRQRRVSVTGGAGTGKTLLAMEKARRLAAEGFRVLLTCFNRPLADYLRRSAGPVERLRILNFHQLCWELAEQAGIPLPDPSAVPTPPELFTSILPNALLDALDRVEDRFDAVIVDEGQDFNDTWWDPLQLCMADSDGGVLYVFHDDNQQVYRRAPTFPRDLVEITLHENLRNTQCIHAATSKFYRGERLRAVGPEGRNVEWICVASTHEIEPAVSRALHRLIREESIAPADIGVLVGSSRTSPLRKDSVVGAFELTKDQTAEPGKVLLDSIRRFKGLERRVIVLTGIDELAPEDENGLLYVALSRARVHLVVIATASTIARCQAPACP